MLSLRTQLSQLLAPVVGGPGSELLLPTRDPKFGDYQCNAAMSTAKAQGVNPRQLAEGWRAELAPRLEGVARLEIAGPGFLNLTLDDSWLAARLAEYQPQQGPACARPRRIVVEYSSPNVAKEMHVGHIRSTIIGDAIARILAFLGHDVVRQNHLGDWGTQFGMLCTHLADHPELLNDDLASIEQLYRQANERYQSEPDFQERARAAVVALHHGESQALQLWERVVDQSRRHFQPLYRRLNVLLERADERGESFYRDQLQGVVDWLLTHFGERRNGLEVKVTDGAVGAFHYDDQGQPLFLNAEKEALPFLIRKSDGAFLYATTDLAAVRYRVDEIKADEILVIVGSPQALHFQMLIATARKAGWLDPERGSVNFEQIAFGSILGADRKPLKTRAGGTVKLAELLDEAVERSAVMLRENNDRFQFSEEELARTAEAIGVGSIKYADLAQSRSSDYLFSWDKMISLEGNTAAYTLYAVARSRSILRNAGQPVEGRAAVRFVEPAERALALQLLRFPETLEQVSQDWKLNLLVDYLYQTSAALMRFYEDCPVLKAEGDLRLSRLELCRLTADTLAQGLGLLGIPLVERM